MKPPKIQEHHLSGAIQLLQVLSSHPLGSGNGGFNPKTVTIFTGKMMMNPGNTCCFRIIFRYRTRHFHFATSPSAPVPSAAPSQLTHPVGSLERPARSTINFPINRFCTRTTFLGKPEFLLIYGCQARFSAAKMPDQRPTAKIPDQTAKIPDHVG